MKLIEFVSLISGVLLVLVIIVQNRGADLGSGSGSELFNTRRGLDKSIFYFTILLATIFVVSIFSSIILN